MESHCGRWRKISWPRTLRLNEIRERTWWAFFQHGFSSKSFVMHSMPSKALLFSPAPAFKSLRTTLQPPPSALSDASGTPRSPIAGVFSPPSAKKAPRVAFRGPLLAFVDVPGAFENAGADAFFAIVGASRGTRNALRADGSAGSAAGRTFRAVTTPESRIAAAFRGLHGAGPAGAGAGGVAGYAAAGSGSGSGALRVLLKRLPRSRRRASRPWLRPTTLSRA